MLTAVVSRVVDVCSKRWLWVVTVGLSIAVVASIFAAHNFRLNSDISSLLSKDLAWRQREIAFEEAFKRYQIIAVVVDAPTPELASAATAELTLALRKDSLHFQSVSNASDTSFFASHAFLFQSKEEIKQSLSGLVRAEPLLRDVASDPSLRGLVAMLEDTLIGVQQDKAKLVDLAPTFDEFSKILEKLSAAQPASFSWRVLMQGKPANSSELRGFIEVRPVLDYGSLEPGRAASDAVRMIANEVAPRYQARARLTGPIAIADQEFGKIKENALRNGLITGAIVLLILWLALRSFRLIAAVVINLMAGLALTAASGTLLVGTFNVISITFAVLFVGIGVDFAIQYSVRYRAERHKSGELQPALISAGRHLAAPLTLAALATAAGFLSFLPTDYKGVSELGLIAGMGMLIAFVSSVTLLPALIVMFDPPGEKASLALSALAPLDNYMMTHRRGIITGTALVVVCGLPLLYWLKFDFDPMHLRDAKSEAVATYLDLARDPATNANAVEVLAPSLDTAKQIAERAGRLPEVSQVLTLSSFVPESQDDKIAAIRQSGGSLSTIFDASDAQPSPSDGETVDALREAAGRLDEAASAEAGAGGAAAQRLSHAISALALAPPKMRAEADQVLIEPLKQDLSSLQSSLAADRITMASLPQSLKDNWVTRDGRARVSIAPKGTDDTARLRSFATAVLAVAPNATEGAISIYEAGRTIVTAFVEAGLWALTSIAIILWLVLRRIGDVLLTLVPLILAGVITMEFCVILGMPLNFANIIALPLLLGVGVAFKIYYITAWREGETHLLQSSLTRAVIFSSMTTATAFGSLWFSSHPGTSSMGKLLALSLVATLAAAVLFQPILMGPPRVMRTRPEDPDASYADAIASKESKS